MRDRTDDEDIRAFEGLVGKTAELFAAQLGLEIEDLKQELRIKVVTARRAFDPKRCRTSEKAFVYSCLVNYVKDLKRNAARRAAKSVREEFIEDHRNNAVQPDAFDYRYQHLSQEEVYALVEEDGFILPATITPDEQKVLQLLLVGYLQSEIGRLLEMPGWRVVVLVKGLRDKLADWRPDPEPPVAAVIALPAPPALARVA